MSPPPITTTESIPVIENSNTLADLPFMKNVLCLRQDDNVRALQTAIRDELTPRNEFVFNANRLIRLVIEESLNQLPHNEITVTTPAGCNYDGLKFVHGNCGVSVIRSGEAMERGLRECCRSMRIGKILIQSTDVDSEESSDPKVFYAKLPPNVNERKVLLMYPNLDTGRSVHQAIEVLRSYGVAMENVILVTLFASPDGLRSVLTRNPALRVVTSEIHSAIPYQFGRRYFGS